MTDSTCPLDICDRPTNRPGKLCPGHQTQKQRHQEFRPLTIPSPDPEVRFWAKVDKSGDCWIWTAAKNQLGYGLFCEQNPITKKNTMHKAHRLAYELTLGPIEAGKHLDHMCHVPSCVNPAHLRPTSNKENMENRAGANANSKTGVRGVHYSKRIHRFVAQVKHNNVSVYSANFLTLEDAAEAVLKARLEYFTHNDLDRV